MVLRKLLCIKTEDKGEKTLKELPIIKIQKGIFFCINGEYSFLTIKIYTWQNTKSKDDFLSNFDEQPIFSSNFQKDINRDW